LKTTLEPKRRPRNPNHPKKGSHTVVYPIERIEDIQSVKKLLANNPRDYLLFVMGVNNGLRVGDLLSLRVKGRKRGQLCLWKGFRQEYLPADSMLSRSWG
jgi:hypothetical protein